MCPTCEESRLNPWRKTVCCAQHYQLREVYLQFRDGIITMDQAKEMLENIGITVSDGDNLKQGYKDFLNKVFEAGISPVVSVFKKKNKK